MPRIVQATLIAFVLACASAAHAQMDRRTAPWVADQGDGTYRNPVLIGDYSDPDVVRVGDDFYLTASSFVNAPGLPILHSRDLVNWTIIGHALEFLPPRGRYEAPRRGGGVWAPAIRHHNGRFYIYYPDPDLGIFVVTAADPRGPWSAPVLVDANRGAIDPAPFWDEDGQAWLAMAWARSRAGVNNIVTLKRMSPDGMRTLEEGRGRTIIDGSTLAPVATSNGPMPWVTIEGPKIYRRDGWYYIFAPAGGVKSGWQGVFRSRTIEGPYEARNVLDQGRTEINGPHQGAWVDTPRGEHWFFHFQDIDSYGRVVWLQPMRWRSDGWPVIGADRDNDGRGEPVLRHRMPRLPRQPFAAPVSDDEFNDAPNLAWQWNSNHSPYWRDASAPAGVLRLNSASSSVNLYEAGNLLTQKLPAYDFTATTRLTFAPRGVGERAGLLMFGYNYGWIGLERTASGVRIVQVTRNDANGAGAEIVTPGPAAPEGAIVLRLTAEKIETPEAPPADNQSAWPSLLRGYHMRVAFSYSTDGEHFTPLGAPFTSRQSRWVGAQMGLFAQAPSGTPAFVATANGYADFDWFRVTR